MPTTKPDKPRKSKQLQLFPYANRRTTEGKPGANRAQNGTESQRKARQRNIQIARYWLSERRKIEKRLKTMRGDYIETSN